MEDLIKALQIFLKYGNPRHPTYCEYEKLYVFIDPSVVSSEDKRNLYELSFLADEGMVRFFSFRYGSG